MSIDELTFYIYQRLNSLHSLISLYVSALYMTFFTLPMMLTCACIVFCNLLVMARIIMMKIKPDPQVMLSEQTSTTKVGPSLSALLMWIM